MEWIILFILQMRGLWNYPINKKKKDLEQMFQIFFN